MEEPDTPTYFGEWIKQRRKALDLTQAELATRAGCSLHALRKIEVGERRPSKQLAGLLAKSLEIPPDDQTLFIRVARGELGVGKLHATDQAESVDLQPAKRSRLLTGNLPGRVTPLIGREHELAEIINLLNDPNCRLLTLVGPGGIGKTCLAIEAARKQTSLFPDGVWFVPLASLDSPVFLIPTIADALNFRFQDPSQPLAQLLNNLYEKRCLLVLDNAEHLLDGVSLFTDILQSAPQVKLLVTSLERLNLLSEWVFEIQGLPLPPDDQADQFESYSAIALYIENARRGRAGYVLRENDRRWVLDICRMVEGMPLGVELAAAWAGVLTPEKIAREIASNLDFLSVSLRDLPERHRSLRATLDHSWNLLNAEEKLILSRLSVFRGSFRLEAAQEICGASLGVMSSLRNKSLLHVAGEDSYELHDLIRQYAVTRLAENPSEDEQVKDRHASYYVHRLSEWEKTLKSSRQVETLNEIGSDIDNIRQGWQRMIQRCQSDALRNIPFDQRLIHNALFSLSLFHEIRCRNMEAIDILTESRACLKAALETLEMSENRWRLEAVLGHITAYLGLHYHYTQKYELANSCMEEALKLLGNDQSRVERAQVQVMIGFILATEERYQESIRLIEQCQAVFQAEGDQWWYIHTLQLLAWPYLHLGKIQKSQSLYQEGLRLIEPGDLRLREPFRSGLAHALYLQKKYTEAEQILQENLELCSQLGNKRETSLVHLYLGMIALATGRIELAEDHIQKSIHFLNEKEDSRRLATRLIYLGKCLAVRQELEAAKDKFIHAIKIGQALDLFYLVYWGLVDLTRVYLAQNQIEKALQIAFVIERCPTKHLIAQSEGDQLIEDLQAEFPPLQIKAAREWADGRGIESLLEAL